MNPFVVRLFGGDPLSPLRVLDKIFIKSHFLRMSVPIFEDDASMPPSIKKAVSKALPAFIASEDEKEIFKSGLQIADAFGDESGFSQLFAGKAGARDEAESLMTASFRRNIGLLVQKTWVEKADEALKEEVLFRIDGLCKNLAGKEYSRALRDFLPVLQDTVYLLFGAVSKEPGFLEYAVRIDPDFGFFWYYINSLEGVERWSAGKCRAAVFFWGFAFSPIFEGFRWI